MAKINDQDISPREFLSKCSKDEIYELDFILGAKMSMLDNLDLELALGGKDPLTLMEVLKHCLEFGTKEGEVISKEVENRIKRFLGQESSFEPFSS